jgi:fatty acid desaturase
VTTITHASGIPIPQSPVRVIPSGLGGDRRNPYRPHRQLIPPQRIRELSRLRPWISVRDTLWCWAWIIGAWAFVAAVPHWWAVALAVPVIGSRYYALFIIGHDGMHRRIFNSVRANDWFTDLLLIGPISMVNRVNSRNHLEHHQNLANDDDPDLHKHACFNKSDRWEYVLFLTGLASVISVFRNLFVRTGKVDGAGRDAAADSDAAADNANQRRRSTRDLCLIAGWQMLLLVGLTALAGVSRGGTLSDPLGLAVRGWWGYPLLWLAPVYLFTYLPNLIRSFVEHSHPENDDKADEHRLITFLSNPIERLFFSPMNMNYHIGHHLWPSIPYYNLPTIDAELRAIPVERRKNLTWRGTYLGYLWTYLVALPLAECRASRHRAKIAQPARPPETTR